MWYFGLWWTPRRTVKLALEVLSFEVYLAQVYHDQFINPPLCWVVNFVIRIESLQTMKRNWKKRGYRPFLFFRGNHSKGLSYRWISLFFHTDLCVWSSCYLCISFSNEQQKRLITSLAFGQWSTYITSTIS